VASDEGDRTISTLRHVASVRLERRPKLFAIDIDHTLIRSTGELARATIDAISLAHARDVEVVLCSSRPPRAMEAYLGELRLWDPAAFVSLQGALTGSYSIGGGLRVIDRQPMSLHSALAVTDFASELNIATNWYSGDRWLVSQIDADVERESDIVGFGPETVDLSSIADAPEKLLLIFPQPLTSSEVAAVNAMSDGIVAQQSNTSYLEITRVGVDKSTALARYVKGRNIDPADVVAIGDGKNDLGMFAFAGLGVAPANATREILAIADFVTESNDADGVAVAIESLVS